MSTVITGNSTGEPCRQFRNELSDEMEKIEAENTKEVAAEKLRSVAKSSLIKGMMEGDMERGAVMAGQVAPLIKERKSCADIMGDILKEAKL